MTEPAHSLGSEGGPTDRREPGSHSHPAPASPEPRAPRSRARRALFALAASLVSLLFALALGEIGLRLAGRRPRPEAINGFFHVSDPVLGWRNRCDATFRYELARTVVRTGAHGERLGWGPGADSGRPIVLFVGDSTTFCGEVEDEETGPSEVAKRLPPELGVAVVNAGVRAFNTIQATRMAAEWLAREPGRVALVVFTYCDNDYVENVNPQVYLPERAPVGRMKDGKVVWVEVAPPPPDGWGRPFTSEEPLGERLLAKLAQSSALGNGLGTLFFRRRLDGPPVRMLPDGCIAPVYPAFWDRAVKWAHEHDAGGVLREALRELARVCERGKAKLLVTRFTILDDGRPGTPPSPRGTREKFFEAVRDARVPFADVGGAFTGEPTSYISTIRAFTDAHYGTRGTATYASALAPRIAEVLRAK